MPSKIVQFQIDLERLAEQGCDIAADWVFDHSSELYRKYRGLRKDDFLKLMEKDGDEAKMTKRQLIPIGVGLVDKGNSSELVPLVFDFDGSIISVFDVFGYIGLNLTREQIVTEIMELLNK